MKKISTLLLLAMAAATLSGCKTGRAANDEPDEPSKVTTITVDATATVSSSSSKPAPTAVQPVESNPNSEGGESSQTPPEASEPKDYDPNAYYSFMGKGAGVMIVNGGNKQEKIEIPATINERAVVSITSSQKKTLFPNAKTIILPETLTDIHNYAFTGCKYLTEINIPSGVTEIGENAFLNCSSLAELEFPEGLKKIGAGAFGGCTSLTSIALPDSVTSIAYGAFDNSVEFTLTYKGMTFNAYNINDLYTMLM